MITSLTSAIVAADHAASIIAGRLHVDLESLYEQIDEIDLMTKNDPLSDHEQSLFDRLKNKVLALDPTRPETMNFT